MSTILRREKGSALTHDEMDDNLAYLISGVDGLYGRMEDVEGIAQSVSQIAYITNLPEADSLDYQMEFSVRDPNPFPPIFQKVRLETLAQYIQNHGGGVSESYVQSLYDDLKTYADAGDESTSNDLKSYVDSSVLPEAYGVGSYTLAAIHDENSLFVGNVIPANAIVPGSALLRVHFRARFFVEDLGDAYAEEDVEAFFDTSVLPGTWKAMAEIRRQYAYEGDNDALPSLFMRIA